jgi:hypothetical protein
VVGRVGDELPLRFVAPGEVPRHPVERAGELLELRGAVLGCTRIELALPETGEDLGEAPQLSAERSCEKPRDDHSPQDHTIRFGSGKYAFLCAPLADEMRGSISVR